MTRTTSPSHARRTRGRKALALVAALAVASSTFLAAASSAEAAKPSAPKGTWTSIGAQLTNGAAGSYAHGFRSSTGVTGYCAIDPQNGPSASSSSVTYSSVTSVTGAFTTPGNATMTAAQVERAAYIVNRYGDTTNGKQASAVDYSLAQLSSVSAAAAEKLLPTNSNKAAVKALSDTYLAESKTSSGPYKVNISRDSVDYSGPKFNVNDIGVKSDAGNWVAGFPVTLKITGPATFNANDSKTYTMTSTSSAVTRVVNISGPGTVTVTATVGDLPETTLYVARSSTYQDLFIPGTGTSKSDDLSLTTSARSVSISTSSAISGANHTDTVSLSGGFAGMSASVQATLYGPFAAKPAQSSTIPSSPKVGTVTKTVTFNSSGAASFTTSALSASAAGWYSWVITVPAQQSGFLLKSVSPFGVAAETKLISGSVTLGTTAARTITTGTTTAAHSDAIKLTASSALTGTAVSGTAVLYGPFSAAPASSASVPAGATVVGSKAFTATFSGTTATANVSGLTTTKPGYYTWKVTTAASGAAPAATHNFGVAAETVLVPYLPAVSTAASQPLVVTDGDDVQHMQLRDALTITGGVPASTVTATARLYYAGPAQPSQSSTVPSGAQLVATTTKAVTLSAAGAALAYTDWVALPDDYEAGYYTWVVSLPAGSGGISAAYTSAYGVTAETTFVPAIANQPLVSTVASSQVAHLGDQVTDTLTVDDGGADLEANPLVVTSRLYRSPGAQAIGSTVGPGWQFIGEVTTTITQTGTYETDPIAVPSANGQEGFYVWTYSFPTTGDPDGDGYEGRDDRTVYEEESFTVPYVPVVTTVTSSQVAEEGAQIRDTLTVTGAKPSSTVYVDSTLYGPFDEQPTSGSTIPDGAPVAGTVTTAVATGSTGTATAQTPSVTVGSAGYYVWHETIDGALDGSSEPWDGVFGQASETTVVKWSPQVTTQTSAQVAVAAAELTDTLTVSGMKPGSTLDIVSTLWGPLAEQPDTDNPADEAPADTAVAGTVTTTVTADADGNAVVTTQPVTTTDAGWYAWTETITPGPDDPWNAWASKFGVASETSTLVSVTTTAQGYVSASTDLFDVAHVTGTPPASAYLRYELWQYGDGDQSTDTLVSTTSRIALSDGPGDYVSPTVANPGAGAYYWVEKLYLVGGTDDLGNELPDALLHSGEPRLPAESVAVGSVTTTATGYVITGAPFTDVAHVSGDTPAGSYLTFDLYRQDDSSEDVADDTLVTTTGQVALDGPGDYTSPGVTVDEAGTYYWVEHLYLPGTDTPFHSGEPRLPEESTEVASVSSTATTAVAVGNDFTDVAHVAGDSPNGAYLTFTLFKQGEGEDATQDVYVVETEKVAVTAPGDYVSPTTSVDEAGTYYWVEKLFYPAPDGDQVVHVGAARVASETTVVASVSTKATSAKLGEAVHDTATVTGSTPDGAYLVFRAYGPDPKAVTDEAVFTSEQVPVDGAGDYDSQSFTPKALGDYYWVETLYGADGTVIHAGEFGVKDEISTITARSGGDDGGSDGDDGNETQTGAWALPGSTGGGAALALVMAGVVLGLAALRRRRVS